MPDRTQRPLVQFVSRIGSCATCMRQSLEAAAVAWIVFALTATYSSNATLVTAAQAVASALSVLWLIHIATYAARALNKSNRAGPTTDAAADDGSTALARRTAIGVVLRAAAVGAVVSLPAILKPDAALAFCGQCTKNADCGVSPCRCVNTAPVNSGTVCNECKCD